MDEASVQRGLQKALREASSKSVKTKKETDLAPTDSDASSRSGSPDQCCPICLGKFKDKSFSDGCFHRFCFQCIREWAKVKSTCPLCKTPFKSIIHNVVSSDVYDQYVLQPTENGSLELDRNGARFRYHTTLTTNRRSAWETRMDQLFNRQARLAERIHRENESRQRRQLIYAASLRVHHIATNRFTRFRDTSPQFFRENPAVTHRLIPWLRRDLGVLFNGNDQHVRFMTQYILSLLPNVDIQSEEFHNHLRPFLYGRTEHFIHEFTSFARSPHDMDTYDQMAQYDFRPENPQFTATLRPQHPLVAQENSSSEESENNHSNNIEVIVISDDNESDSNPFVIPAESSQSASLSHDLPGPSSATSGVGPSTSYDLASTHNPEPPASQDPDQPGPSGVTLSGSLQIKQEHDSAHGRRKLEDSADSSGSVEIVGYQKPFHLRTPIAFITISDDLSDGKREKETKGRLSRNKDKTAPKRNHVEEKAGGKRKQKTKHTRSLHSSNRAGNWSTDSDDNYYSRSRRDGYNRRGREAADDIDGPCTSRYDSLHRSSSNHKASHSPNELFRKVREGGSKWSLYYETRHDNYSSSRNRRSRSRSRSRSTYSRRYGEDSRSRDCSRDLPRPLRDERNWQRSRSRSRSRERSRNQSRYHREEDNMRSRSRSRGPSLDFFSDESKLSSRNGSRNGSTSSTFSRQSHQDSHALHSSKKDISSSSHVSASKASKRMLEDANDPPNKDGDSHASKRHKHKHKHHKKKSSRHKHKKSRDKDSKSKKKDKHGRDHGGSHDKKPQDDKEKAIGESISDSTVEDVDRPNNEGATHSRIGTTPTPSGHVENHNITLQDLLNMDESMTFDPALPAGHSDKGSGSML